MVKLKAPKASLKTSLLLNIELGLGYQRKEVVQLSSKFSGTLEVASH